MNALTPTKDQFISRGHLERPALQRAMQAVEEKQVDLQPGAMSIQLDTQALANRLTCQPDQITELGLTVEATFQLRRSSFELNLHPGDPPQETDKILMQIVVKGCRWLAIIIDRKSFSEIAVVKNVSTRRVQDVANLALIAPDILDAITLGEQPSGLTTDYLIKTRFSAVWSEQRAQFAAL